MGDPTGRTARRHHAAVPPAGGVGATATASAARRLCQQGGVTVDGQRQADPLAELPVADGMVLRAGKRRYGRVSLR